jgi:hypothetical protein
MGWKPRVVVTAVTLLTAAAAVRAHTPPRMATRELVRVQGHRTAAVLPGVKRRLVFVALGAEQPFAAADWQVFGFSDTPPSPEPAASDTPQRFVLEGSREILTRFAAVRPDQTVTLLAERRPGSTDLFILTLDVCPP